MVQGTLVAAERIPSRTGITSVGPPVNFIYKVPRGGQVQVGHLVRLGGYVCYQYMGRVLWQERPRPILGFKRGETAFLNLYGESHMLSCVGFFFVRM